MKLQETAGEPRIPFVAGIAAGHHEDAVLEACHRRLFQPAGDLGALRRIGDLVQTVDQDEEVIAPQQALRESRGVEAWGDPLDRAGQGRQQTGAGIRQTPQLEEHRHGFRREGRGGPDPRERSA